jgi:hypothetical protein
MVIHYVAPRVFECDVCGERSDAITECEDGLQRCDRCMYEYDGTLPPEEDGEIVRQEALWQ